MPRSLLYGAALTVVLCVVATAFKVTSHSIKPAPCPHCGSTNIRTTYMAAGVLFTCRNCGESFDGPKDSGTFSWLDAIDTWLDN